MEQTNFIKACGERDKPFLFVSGSRDDSAAGSGMETPLPGKYDHDLRDLRFDTVFE